MTTQGQKYSFTKIITICEKCIKKMNFERIIAHKTNKLSLEIISKKGKKTTITTLT